MGMRGREKKKDLRLSSPLLASVFAFATMGLSFPSLLEAGGRDVWSRSSDWGL
jgi:hypothetical protein